MLTFARVSRKHYNANDTNRVIIHSDVEMSWEYQCLRGSQHIYKNKEVNMVAGSLGVPKWYVTQSIYFLILINVLTPAYTCVLSPF